MPTPWEPDAGDIVWLEFDPQAGREQSGHRPAVVLSPARYNAKAGMMICCPTTTRIKGYPFEVSLAGTPPSVVLADQMRSLDWRARHAERRGQVTLEELEAIRQRVRLLVG